jgi:lincosamide nucleotidyltransferase
MTREEMLRRLDDIARSAAETGHVRAVLALGSSGVEPGRMDEYSDLDIWVVVEDGYKQQFLDDLDWLERVCAIAFKYRNSPNGYKLLFEDEVFVEIDIFELEELRSLEFSEARIVWKAKEISDLIRLPAVAHTPHERPLQELLGEALTNLYVGLGRFHRGEKLTAMRFIQGYAVDRILELAHLIESEQPVERDIFGNERRFERRFPGIARDLPGFMQGYERSPASARAILEFLEKHFDIDKTIKQAILSRLEAHPAEKG